MLRQARQTLLSIFKRKDSSSQTESTKVGILVAGILAALAVPFAFLARKRKSQDES